MEQPDLDLDVATIHEHLLLWAMISKLIWGINLFWRRAIMTLDLNTIIGFFRGEAA